MDKTAIYRIIKEEISDYQYLNMDSIKKEQKDDAVLNSKEFQTRLVHDIMNKIVKFDEEYSVVDDIEDNGWGDDIIPRLEKNYGFNYNYGGRNLRLGVDIEGRNLPVVTSGQHIKGDYYKQEEHPNTESVDYSGADVIFWNDGVEIKMPWLEKNDQLKDKFIRSILGDLPNQ